MYDYMSAINNRKRVLKVYTPQMQIYLFLKITISMAY